MTDKPLEPETLVSEPGEAVSDLTTNVVALRRGPGRPRKDGTPPVSRAKNGANSTPAPKGSPKTPKTIHKLFAELPPPVEAKVGRPSSYDPEFCNVIKAVGAIGGSQVEMAVEIGVARTTMLGWAKIHPEFQTALKEAEELALVWWERAGRVNMTRPGFNVTAWIFNVKNRFKGDYVDVNRTEHTGREGGPIEVQHRTPTEMARRMAFMMNRVNAVPQARLEEPAVIDVDPATLQVEPPSSQS
jgi:hypothetical protein